jgi:hypothetical protein
MNYEYYRHKLALPNDRLIGGPERSGMVTRDNNHRSSQVSRGRVAVGAGLMERLKYGEIDPERGLYFPKYDTVHKSIISFC